MSHRDEAEIVYPETDGAPLGENTLQVAWIIALFNGFDDFFRQREDVFIAADLFWYPVYRQPKIVQAPDVMFAFDRPKGYRSSYRQWVEADVAPQVVIEVRSPSNTPSDRARVLKFYEQHGVEEFYEYDPERDELHVWLRQGNRLVPVEVPAEGFPSPWLGVRFEAPGGEPMQVIGPDGVPFRTYRQMVDDFRSEQEARELVERRADRVEKKAEQLQRIAEEKTLEAERDRKLAEEKTLEAEVQRNRAESLAAKLRELGVDPDSL